MVNIYDDMIDAEKLISKQHTTKALQLNQGRHCIDLMLSQHQINQCVVSKAAVMLHHGG